MNENKKYQDLSTAMLDNIRVDVRINIIELVSNTERSVFV